MLLHQAKTKQIQNMNTWSHIHWNDKQDVKNTMEIGDLIALLMWSSIIYSFLNQWSQDVVPNRKVKDVGVSLGNLGC